MATVDMKTLTIGDTTYAPVDETARANNKTLADRVEDIENDTAGYLAQAKSAANTATAKASEAAASATTVTDKATAASASAVAAADSESEARSSSEDAMRYATNAEDAMTAANQAKQAAASSAASAKTDAETATEQAGFAGNSANEALKGASQAATSATNAADSASTATSKATEAANSASAAKTSETNAASSASTATSKASAASTSATNAAKSETNAAASAAEAQAAADSIGGVSYTVPSFWQDTVDETIEAVKAYQDEAGAGCVCFGWCSDMHVHWPYPTDNNYCQNVGNIGAAVMDGADVPLFLNCGDVLTNTVYAEESNVVKAYDWAWDNYLSTIGAERLLLVAGNHDGAYATVGTKDYAKNMKPEKLHRYLYQEQMQDFRREWGASGKYFYLDNKPQKTRFIMLNSHDTEWGEDANGAALCSTMSGGYRQEQMEWLIDALDVPEGWTIVLASHVPPTAKLPTNYNGVRGYDIVRGIVTAYANRTAYSGTYSYNSSKGEGVWANMNVSVNFADAKGTIVGWFCGHCHRDAIIEGDLPFPILTITSAGNFSYDKDNEGTRTLGTANETAVDFVCIDKAAKEINLIRMGAGVKSSRSVVYAGDYTITANLANVSSSNGASLIGGGDSYTTTLTASDGYVLGTVTVTMGGADITSTAYSNGVVSIDNVTGDIVITAEAVSTDPFAFVASNWTGYGGSDVIASVGAGGVGITKGASGAKYASCNHVFTRKAGTYNFEVAVNGTVANNQVNTIIRCFDASGNILEDKTVCVPNHSYTFNAAYKGFMMNTGYGSFTFTLTDAVKTFQFLFSPGSTTTEGAVCTITSISMTEPN